VSSFPATATLTINGTSFNAGSYSLEIPGKSGSTTQSLTVPFNVRDYSIWAPRRCHWPRVGRARQLSSWLRPPSTAGK
jgi:hypothetical protein